VGKRLVAVVALLAGSLIAAVVPASAAPRHVGLGDSGFSSIAEDCFTATPRTDSPSKDRYTAMLAGHAAANGARLVDVYAASEGHDACALPLVRWVEPYRPASPAAPLHPNLIGMQAMARLVRAEMTAAGL
jgi:hypothetical protein